MAAFFGGRHTEFASHDAEHADRHHVVLILDFNDDVVALVLILNLAVSLESPPI